MWIETDSYVGPCRRGGRKMRLLDRRRCDVSDRDPSLPQLLRQLRAGSQALTDEKSRHRFHLRVKATIDLARRKHANGVAQQLLKLARLSELALGDRRNLMLIEQCLLRAHAALPHA